MSDLTGMFDRHAVIDVVTSLFIETDERNWEAVRHCFADAVRFDMTSLAGGDPVVLTPREIAGAWEAGLAPIKAVHHQVGNFRVTVEGDGATVFCYGVAFHYRPVKSGNSVRRFVGTYDLHLVRSGSSWKIDLFRFNAKFVDGNLSLEADDVLNA